MNLFFQQQTYEKLKTTVFSTHQNPTKGVVALSKIFERLPLLVLMVLFSKRHNFFLVDRCCKLDKRFCFFRQYIFSNFSVSHYFALCFENNCVNLSRKVTDNLKLFFLNKKFECVRCFSFFGCCTKCSEIERVMVVQTHIDDENNDGFFLFFPKKPRF